jgi:periplasmic divalent cation tolerance protein
MGKMRILFVYVTVGDPMEAERIGRSVVTERLAACANIIAGMRSIYWWDGRVQQGEEAILILKTASDRFEALRDRLVELHSYDCPGIEALAVEDGHPPFLDWVMRETRPPPESENDGLSDGG